MSTIGLDPAALGIAGVYELLTAAIQPRPIALIGVYDPSGQPRLSAFSFLSAGGTNPASLVLSVTNGVDGRRKDTLVSIEARREFTVNLVDGAMLDQLLAKDFVIPGGSWSEAGLSHVPGEHVNAPRVAESPVQFECRLHQVVAHGSEEGSANYVVGEIVRILVREALWDGAMRSDALDLAARLAGSGYLRLSQLR